MNVEVVIQIVDARYVDALVLALFHQGYAPYITDSGDVAFETHEEEITKITYGRLGDDL